MSDKQKEKTEDFSEIVLKGDDTLEEKVHVGETTVKNNIEHEEVNDAVVKEETEGGITDTESTDNDGVEDLTEEILKKVENSKEDDFKRIPEIDEIDEGVVTFKIENREILKASQVFKSAESYLDTTNLILIVGKRTVTLVNTHVSGFFAKITIPLKGESSVKDGHIGFKVPFNFLFQTVSRQGSEETLSYRYEVGVKKFSIGLSDGDINITAEKDIKGDLKDITKESKIKTKKIQEIENADALKAGLKYISLFVKNNKDNVNLGIVEIRDGMIFGGNMSNVGIFQSEKLGELDLNIPGKVLLNAITKLLDIFSTDSASIWEAKEEEYLYITDGDSCIRFSKETESFPAERGMVLDVDVSKRITTPRSKFIESMDSLSYVSDELTLTIDTKKEKYVGEVLDYCGLSSVRKFDAKASGDICQETLLSIGEFIKVLKHFTSANVEVCFHKAENELIVLLDEIGDYKIRTVLVAYDKEGRDTEDVD